MQIDKKRPFGPQKQFHATINMECGRTNFKLEISHSEFVKNFHYICEDIIIFERHAN